MSAFLVVPVTVINMDWLPEYVVGVPPIVRSHGGRFIGVSKNPPNAVELLEGDGAVPDGFALIQFPSMANLKAFMDDPAYAPFKEARQAGSRCDFYAFENNDDAPQFIGQ